MQSDLLFNGACVSERLFLQLHSLCMGLVVKFYLSVIAWKTIRWALLNIGIAKICYLNP